MMFKFGSNTEGGLVKIKLKSRHDGRDCREDLSCQPVDFDKQRTKSKPDLEESFLDFCVPSLKPRALTS